MTTLFLLCNAHLDPVWQWEWEEGAAAAVSTFRAAADLCEQYEGFVFNHNEALLYRWVEEYEPALFSRIQRLVTQGRWHIMGGWYLQPDCNLPSGESLVRQILYGRTYFQEKFGVTPTTAISFDAFGHSRGLVQILRRAGYDSYIYLRPEDSTMPQEFRWLGFDGSETLVHRIWYGYNTPLGQAHQRIADRIAQMGDEPRDSLVLWGVGNHGGGPSRLDIECINELMQANDRVTLAHATPEQYFASLARRADELPQHADELNPRFVGCYSSMVRVKQGHRQLENELFAVEKMLSAAALQGLLAYPSEELAAAFHDLMLIQFHDILPGTGTQPVEETALRLLGHGREIAARLRARAFFALAAGQSPADEGEYPILIYNPHPFPVRGIWSCEFMLADQNWKQAFSLPVVYSEDGERLSTQAEKEHSNINLDWRKRAVFAAELQPAQMNRFTCRIALVERRPRPTLGVQEGAITFRNQRLTVRINAHTGLLDAYEVDGILFLAPNAFLPVVVADNADPWRMDTSSFGPVIGAFALMDPGAGSDVSGVRDALLPSVRVIEQGEVRTVIEAVLQYRRSVLVLTYRLPAEGTELELGVRVYWNEQDKLLKLVIPTLLKNGVYLGQTVFGVQRLRTDGSEVVAQKWVAVADEAAGLAVTCSNDGVYGSDYCEGALRPTLLRGTGYCTHPILDRPLIEPDRFNPRIDQGERTFTFRLQAGPLHERLERIDREALVFGEQPYALSFFPPGSGSHPGALVTLSDEAVQLVAFKGAEDGRGFILRLFEPTGTPRTTTLALPALGLVQTIQLAAFELKTLRLDTETRSISEVNLLETGAVWL